MVIGPETLESLAATAEFGNEAVFTRLRDSLKGARATLKPGCSRCTQNAVRESEKKAFDSAKRSLAAAHPDLKRKLGAYLKAERLEVQFKQGNATYSITL
jgi:hypothetical protein